MFYLKFTIYSYKYTAALINFRSRIFTWFYEIVQNAKRKTQNAKRKKQNAKSKKQNAKRKPQNPKSKTQALTLSLFS
jgi:hypothetical protein